MNESKSAPIPPRKIPARESARALLALAIPRNFDVARLRPHNLPRGRRFETEADARARRDTELDRPRSNACRLGAKNGVSKGFH